MSDRAVVGVKSSWLSKINWVAVPAAIVAIGTVFGLDIPQDKLRDAFDILGLASSGLFGGIAVLRTFFTKKITTASAKKL